MASKSFDNLIKEIGSMSVLELSQLVKAFEAEFGVSAAASMSAAAAPAAGAAEAAQEEKASFKVLLVEGGAEKLKAIKALRQVVTTLGLAEAKKAVEDASDAAPFVVAESAAKADAQKMKEVLEAAGAKVKMQ